MSDRPGRPPSYHYVRRNLDSEERRTLLIAAAGAAVGVGAIVLYLGRIVLARDRIERAPAAPPPPGTPGPDEIRPDELRADTVVGSNGKADR